MPKLLHGACSPEAILMAAFNKMPAVSAVGALCGLGERKEHAEVSHGEPCTGRCRVLLSRKRSRSMPRQMWTSCFNGDLTKLCSGLLGEDPSTSPGVVWRESTSCRASSIRNYLQLVVPIKKRVSPLRRMHRTSSSPHTIVYLTSQVVYAQCHLMPCVDP